MVRLGQREGRADVRRPADLAADETFIAADLADYAQVEKIVAGVDGIVHLGGFSVEGPWDTILSANIVGCYNLFEAAHRAGVKRVVFASSNHAMGFYPRTQRIGVDVTVRPDSRPKPVTMLRAKAALISKKSPSSATFRISSLMS